MRVRFMWLAAAAAVLGAGCAGGGGGGGGNNNPPGNSFTLQPTTKVLPSDGSVQQVAITENSVTLAGAVPTLAVGNTVVYDGPGDHVFTRKVTGIRTEGPNTILETRAADFADVYNDADIKLNYAVPEAIYRQFQPATEGITIEHNPPSSGRNAEFPIRFKFDHVRVASSSSASVAAFISGHVDIRIGVEADLKVGTKGFLDPRPKVHKFRVFPYINGNASLTCQMEGSGSFTHRIPISTNVTIPVPGLGVGIRAGGQLFLEADIRADGTATMSLSGGINVGAGIDCTNDEWKIDHRNIPTWNVVPPQVAFNGSLRVSVLQPQFNVNMFDIGHAYVNGDVVRAGVDVAFRSSPRPGFDVVPFGEFRVKCGGKLNLGPLTLWEGDFAELQLPRFNIGNPIFVPGNGGPPRERILFLKAGNSGRVGIYATSPTAGGEELIYEPAPNSGTIIAYDVSRDGTMIAFITHGATRKLYMMPSGGGTTEELADSNSLWLMESLAWDPSGTRLAVGAATNSNVPRIYLVDTTTKGVTGPLNTGGSLDTNPTFNHTGTQIFYSAASFSNQFAPQIRSYHLGDGTVQTWLSDPNRAFLEPKRAQDRQIFATSFAQNAGTVRGIWWTDATSNRFVTQDDNAHNPSLNPDGTWIAYERGTGENRQVVVVDSNGGNKMVMKEHAWRPVWAILR